MKARPIIFSGESVRGILAGRKTQTRRAVKPQPEPWMANESFLAWRGKAPLTLSCLAARCPFGAAGDRLWVREMFQKYQTVNHVRKNDGRSFSEVGDGCAAYRADGHDTIKDVAGHIRLMSDASTEAVLFAKDAWSSPIHMPRWASRLTLEVAAVRVERLHEITPRDCMAEGGNKSVIAFRYAWNALNAKRGFGWTSNPWVWCVTFKVAS